MSPRRGDVWLLDDGRSVLVLSSTFYNEIASEPTIIVIPVFTGEPAAGFGVPIGDDIWAAPGFITNLRKSRLAEFHDHVDVQTLTDVNNMLFKILATPDRWPVTSYRMQSSRTAGRLDCAPMLRHSSSRTPSDDGPEYSVMSHLYSCYE